MGTFKTILNSFLAFFGFAEQMAENKGEKIKLMKPKWIQKGINRAAVLKNNLDNKMRPRWARKKAKRERKQEKRSQK